MLFGVFLPGLLFEAAYHIEFKQFWRNRLAISSLAMPGVVAAIALTALIFASGRQRLAFRTGFHLETCAGIWRDHFCHRSHRCRRDLQEPVYSEAFIYAARGRKPAQRRHRDCLE